MHHGWEDYDLKGLAFDGGHVHFYAKGDDFLYFRDNMALGPFVL